MLESTAGPESTRAWARPRTPGLLVASCFVLTAACGESSLGPHQTGDEQESALDAETRDRDESRGDRPAILIDASRDGGVWWYPQGLGGFDPEQDHQGRALADYLRLLGYQVDELPRAYVVSADLLEGYELVIRANAFSGYAPDEVAAYEAWVNRGGSLLLLNDHMRYAAPDQVGAAFGIVFAGVTRGSQLLGTLEDHPIAEDVGVLFYGVGSAIVEAPPSARIVGRLTEAGYADLDLDEVRSVGDIVAPAVLGAMTWGSGRIVFAGDTNMWQAVPQPLVDNVLDWLTR